MRMWRSGRQEHHSMTAERHLHVRRRPDAARSPGSPPPPNMQMWQRGRRSTPLATRATFACPVGRPAPLSRWRTAPGRRRAPTGRSRSSRGARGRGRRRCRSAFEAVSLKSSANETPRPGASPTASFARERRFFFACSESSKCCDHAQRPVGQHRHRQPGERGDAAGLLHQLLGLGLVVLVGLRHRQVVAGEVAGPQHRVGRLAQRVGEVGDAVLGGRRRRRPRRRPTRPRRRSRACRW